MESKDLIALIQAYEKYQKDTQKVDLEDFAHWILKKQAKFQTDDTQLNRNLGYALNRFNRHAKMLAKQYLEGLSINSLDEFSFLTSIKILKNPSKSDIYDNTLTELATGQQMMRRLIQIGLVEEVEDEKDKRVKRVRLTTEGEKVQSLAFEKIGEECNFKFKVLDKDHKILLLEILNRLLSDFE